jgi:LacI family transcriptional regulator
MTRFEECGLMLDGISQYSRSHRPWDIFLDDQALAEAQSDWARDQGWDGVISRHTTARLVHTCRELGLPLVDLNDVPRYPGVPKIRPDNRAIGHLGGEHFLERGYTHYGFCGFGNEPWSGERRDGFIEAVRFGGHEPYVMDQDYPGGTTPDWDEAQKEILKGWLKRLPGPLAVMACNDMRAQQVVGAAQSLDLLIPEELAVLGANNETHRCVLPYPPLSSVAANPFRSGYRAAEIMDGLLAGESRPDLDERIDPVGVVTRHSTDVLAIDDPHVAAALSMIREQACFGLTVPEVLAGVTASRSQLEKRFRKTIGRSPQAEIRRVQVARMKQLLFETDFPLKKIAELTGYDHIEYMSVVFKRMEGISPGAYRKKVRTEGQSGSD